MISDVNALIPIFTHVMVAPITLGSLALPFTGGHSVLVVHNLIEFGKIGMTSMCGAFNASYMIQFLTIIDHTWINQFHDNKVIASSIIFSILHYIPSLGALYQVIEQISPPAEPAKFVLSG